MNKDFAEKWATALESGQYKKTVGALHNKEGYCCLGVACELLGLKKGEHGKYVDRDGHTLMNVLNDTVAAEIGMKSRGGDYDNYNNLWSDNDAGYSFKEIAKIIRDKCDDL